MEAIILAGGRGTRLQSVVTEVPKPMAEVKGVPFLEHLMAYWCRQGVKKFILSVGYRGEQIITHFNAAFQGVPVVYAREDKVLGTGGALELAATLLASSGPCLVLNGDTLFGVSLLRLTDFHVENEAVLSIAAKRVSVNERYGGIETDASGRVTGWEKDSNESHSYLINGGVYLFAPAIFLKNPKGTHFPSSLEHDLIPDLIRSDQRVYAVEFDTPFLDIGIPDDYRRAEDFVGFKMPDRG